MIRVMCLAMFLLAACVTAPPVDARTVTLLACAAQDATPFYRVNGRAVTSDAIVAALKSAGAPDQAFVIVQADPALSFGDVSDLLLRLRVSGFDVRDVQMLDRSALECVRR